MTPLIRDMNLEKDRPTLERFILGSNTYEARWESDRRLDDAVGRDFLPVLLDRVAQRQGRIFVAEAHGAPIAWAVCYVDPHDAFVREEERACGYVAELFVEEDWRGRHVGRMLLKACEDHFHALGVKTVLISALSPNTRAVNAYRTAGYSDYAVYLRKLL